MKNLISFTVACLLGILTQKIAAKIVTNVDTLMVSGGALQEYPELTSIYESVDPFEVGALLCQNKNEESCMYLLVNTIERLKSIRYGQPLYGWRYEERCNCVMPPRQEKLPLIQFLHIPKTGTAINWALRGYFEDCELDPLNPCPNHLTNGTNLLSGLCDGKLFSCAGHHVSKDLPSRVLSGESVYMFTMLRHPWDRLQSTFHYLKQNPISDMLKPEISTKHLLSRSQNISEFLAYPGISNCMTKMLNGIRCGANVRLNDSHLTTAKSVVRSMLGFGITEYFDSSVCLFYWMYGGSPPSMAFKSFRNGAYDKQAIEMVLGLEGAYEFKRREYYDLALYSFAKDLFLNRFEMTGCPIGK